MSCFLIFLPSYDFAFSIPTIAHLLVGPGPGTIYADSKSGLLYTFEFWHVLLLRQFFVYFAIKTETRGWLSETKSGAFLRFSIESSVLRLLCRL